MQTGHTRTFGRRSGRARALSLALPSVGWKSAGALAVLCSGVAWASLPRVADVSTSEQREWRTLGIAPLSNGGATGARMEASAAVEPVEFVAARAASAPVPEVVQTKPADSGPLRIRGRVG